MNLCQELECSECPDYYSCSKVAQKCPKGIFCQDCAHYHACDFSIQSEPVGTKKWSMNLYDNDNFYEVAVGYF